MTLLTRKRNPTMPDLSEFMTTQEAAQKLGFHVKRIPGMVKNKTLDGVRFGSAWLVSRQSVDDYLSKTIGVHCGRQGAPNLIIEVNNEQVRQKSKDKNPSSNETLGLRRKG